jgi:hypothetical protein
MKPVYFTWKIILGYLSPNSRTLTSHNSGQDYVFFQKVRTITDQTFQTFVSIIDTCTTMYM